MDDGAVALRSQEDLTDGASRALSLSKHLREASPPKNHPEVTKTGNVRINPA